jgi:hypothetical protein
MITARTSSRGSPSGRHAAPQRPGRAKRGRLISGALMAAAALVAVAFIVMPARPGIAPARSAPNSTAPHFSPAQVRELAQATPAQRSAIDHALVTSFSRYARAGTGSMPAPGQVSLTAKAWSWGITGQHVWIIMSFTDIHNGLLGAITGDCIGMFQVAHATAFAWLCGGLEQLLAHLSNGYRPESNHGVWAALYWWPPGEVQSGYW